LLGEMAPEAAALEDGDGPVLKPAQPVRVSTVPRMVRTKKRFSQGNVTNSIAFSP